MRRVSGFLLMVVVGCLLLASCSESKEFDELGTDTDEGTETTDGAGGDTADDDVAAAVDELERQGLDNDLASCVVDALVDQGFAPSDLVGNAFPDEDLMDALALAGAECAEFADGLPAGAFDLDDPAVRDGFITSFAASSGLSEEVGECVLDFLIDNEVDAEALLPAASDGRLDPEIQTLVEDGVTACT